MKEGRKEESREVKFESKKGRKEFKSVSRFSRGVFAMFDPVSKSQSRIRNLTD